MTAQSFLSDDRINAIFDAQQEEYGQLCDRLDMQMFARACIAAYTEMPIDMVLHCPACGLQHIDAPEKGKLISGGPNAGRVKPGWTNPPHRSHLCHGCDHVWRPADVPTNGVAAVKTKGKNDSEVKR